MARRFKSRPRPAAKTSSIHPVLLILLVLLACLIFVVPVVRADNRSLKEPEDGTGHVIGIDLGTTYSCVAVSKGGKIEVIPNKLGNRITPSWVSFSESGRLVGDAAKNAFQDNPKSTIFDVKRFIGRRFEDPQLTDDIKHFPFQVISDAGRPVIKVDHNGAIKKFNPEEISAIVLSHMRETAEAYLGEKVTHAVVTVPAYFNDAQRQATKDAGAIAGLTIIRVINEPTAAALAYGLGKKANPRGASESNILVYDLGGGTFDVSLLSVEDGVFEVLSTAGDTHLGGEDFDNRVIDYLVDRYRKSTGTDVKGNYQAMSKLKSEVEKAKRTLSTQVSTKISIDSFENGHDFSETLTRAKFEELNMDLFRKTLKPVEQVLGDAKMKKGDVDHIVLVGGSTRIPKVQSILQEFFNGKELYKDINPDEAVAHGAAVQGGILAGDEPGDILLVLDITPLSVGIETTGGVFTKIIPRNTVVPAYKNQTFSTAFDNQSSVRIQIFEGERPLTKDNNLLGTFDLDGIPSVPRGVPEIVVSFSIDANGILHVQAQERSTGKSGALQITSTKDRLTDAELARMVEELEMSSEDHLTRKLLEVTGDLEGYIYGIKNHLEVAEAAAGGIKAADKSEILAILGSAEDWIRHHRDSRNPDIFEDKLHDTRSEVEAVLNKPSRGGARHSEL